MLLLLLLVLFVLAIVLETYMPTSSYDTLVPVQMWAVASHECHMSLILTRSDVLFLLDVYFAVVLCAVLLLCRAHCVALVTGEGFGYPKGIRISYAASMEDLDEALGEVSSKPFSCTKWTK